MPIIYRHHCFYCGKYYIGQGKLFCSIECSKQFYYKNDGLTAAQRYYRKNNGLSHKIIRHNNSKDILFFLYNNQCAFGCGKKPTLIHHIDGKNIYKNKRCNVNNNLSNLLPLCLSCHTSLHNQAKKNNRWSIKFDVCLECLLKKYKHVGNGLCANCYMRNWRKNNEEYYIKSYTEYNRKKSKKELNKCI